MHMIALIVLLVSLLVVSVVGPPVLPGNEIDNDKDKQGGKTQEEHELGLPYERYLKQIIDFLEKDERFREKLTNAKMEDITSGKIAHELQFVDHRIRSRLDELKREELKRLRDASKRENELEHGSYDTSGHLGIDRRRLGLPMHVDARNPHTFEIEDLKKLVQQTTKDLENLDRQRKEDFKRYEMEKEHRRREELQKMDEEHRRQAEKQHEEQVRRHKEHPRLHHPGSKQQLEQVWEKEDNLPTEEFNPLTFFQMHDLDGDGHWDEEEVKSLFRQELNKMYEQNNTDDDMEERREEMDRMREHVVNETDVNRDGLVSLQEFLDMSKRNEFTEDPGWEGLDEQQLYDDNEFQEFERQYQAGMIPPGAVYVPGNVPHGAQYQYVPDQGSHPPEIGQPMYPSHQGYGQVPQGAPQFQAGQPHGQFQQPGQYQGGPQAGQFQTGQQFQGGQQQFQGGQQQYQAGHQQFQAGQQQYPGGQQQFQAGQQQQFQAVPQAGQPSVQQQAQGGQQQYQSGSQVGQQQHPGQVQATGQQPPPVTSSQAQAAPAQASPNAVPKQQESPAAPVTGQQQSHDQSGQPKMP